MGLTLADRYRGKYFVIYPNGQRSIGMKKSVAKGYREIFGGTLAKEILPEKKPCSTPA